MESDLKDYAIKVEETFHIMEEEKLKTETVFSSIAEGLFTVDNNWIITSFNPAAEKITGIKASYAVGKPCHEIIHGELCKKHECALSKSKKTGRVMLNIEGKIRDSMGHWLPVIISTAPLRNPQNKITGGVETFRDVSELERVNHELVRLNNIKTDFLSMVSHELKTPLTIVKGYSELLVHGKFGELLPHQKEIVSMIRNKVDKLNFLINDLLDVSQLEFGKFKINKQLFSLTKLLTNKKEEFKIIAEKKNLKLDFNSCPEEIVINGDQERISQVLSNLISNAIKFTNPGGKINVSLENGSNFININVVDTGIGMKHEKIENIFDKFYQIDTSNTRQYSGIGLGLAISKDIIEMHGGKINVKSEPGCGSTFSVILPYKTIN
ncbi:PAS domain-containing sensor histidine kinase [Candidatus Desantisbacteria bacterium]|nr:PAS domain-containing sensor histidine kinase [Candidatus Desantisbacteria bacterium]